MMTDTRAQIGGGLQLPKLGSRAPGIFPPAAEREPRSLTSAVYKQLRRDIVFCAYRPGTRLRIAELKERFDVSPSAVREALSRLVADGLVRAVDQAGFRVSPVSLEDIVDIASTRVELEATALRLSIAAGDSHWEAGILQAHDHLAAATPPAQNATSEQAAHYAEADRLFHTSLVVACGSSWLLKFRDMLHEQVVRYCNYARVLTLPAKRDVAADHRELMEAVLARDVDRSTALVATHFKMTSDRVETAIADRTWDVDPSMSNGSPLADPLLSSAS